MGTELNKHTQMTKNVQNKCRTKKFLKKTSLFFNLAGCEYYKSLLFNVGILEEKQNLLFILELNN